MIPGFPLYGILRRYILTKTNHTNNTPSSEDVAPRRAYQQTVDAVLAQNKSHVDGLSADEAAARLQSFGPTLCRRKRQASMATLSCPL
jgi:hypothetical protein